MDIKEVIEFLQIDIKCLNREIEYCNPNDDIDAQVIIANKKAIEKYKDIISLLQQGEKYRQMCSDIYSTVKDNKCFKNIVTKEFQEYLDTLKEVYFPKEAQK